MTFRVFVALLVTLAISACATVGSQDLDGARRGATRGQVYYLPKVVFIVGVRADPARNDLVFEAHPYYVADVAAGPLVLNHTQGWFTDDDVKTPVDDRGLLQTIDVTFDSRADAIFQNLGTLAAQTALTTNFIVSDVVDPADPNDLAVSAALITNALHAWGEQGRPEGQTRDQAQAFDRTLPGRAARTAISLEWTWEGDARTSAPLAVQAGPPPAALAGAPDGACVEGVCVRAPRPGRFRLYRDGVLVGAYQASIPNRAPRTVIPIQGGVFADRTVQVQFDNGMPTQVHRDGGNEIEGGVTSVVGGVTAFFTATANNIQGETARMNADTNRIRARAQRAEALRAEAAGAVPAAASASSDQSNNSQSSGQSSAGQTTDQSNSGAAPAPSAGQQRRTEPSNGAPNPEPGAATATNRSSGAEPNAATNTRRPEHSSGLDTWVISLFGPASTTTQRENGQRRRLNP